MGWPRLLSAYLLYSLATYSFVHGALTIRRNQQDCMYPRIAANAENLWPSPYYLPKGNSIRQSNTGFLVDSTAGFSIEYFGTYKIITNKLVNEQYLVYQCGTSRPNVAGITKVFEGPLVSVSSADATAADYLTQMRLMDRVAYAGELAVSGCLQALAACGYVAPDDPSSSDLRDSVDAFWIFGFSTSSDPMSISFNAPSALKPLERTKWLAYAAAFFNTEYVANSVYLGIRDAYLSLRRDALSQRGPQPVVCWVYVDWDGDYAMTWAQYKVEYVKDAGGRMLSFDDMRASGMVPKPDGSTTTLVYKHASDQVAASWAGVLQQCQIIIDESYEMSTGGITEMDATSPDGFLQAHGIKGYEDQLPAWSNAAVYTLAGTIGQTVTRPGPNNGAVGLDWFERGVSRCDEVLRDLISVIQPSVQNSLLNGWTRRFLLRLDGKQQQTRVPATCLLDTAKLDNCVRAGYAARICPNAIRNCDTGVLEYPTLDKRCAYVSEQAKTRRKRKRIRPKVPECLKRPV